MAWAAFAFGITVGFLLVYLVVVIGWRWFVRGRLTSIRVLARGMRLLFGPYRAAVIWNHPVWALTYGRWTFGPAEDRVWFLRSRIGPIKVQVTKERQR
jgi:hypothetical protein